MATRRGRSIVSRIGQHKSVQAIARNVLSQLESSLTAFDSERSVAERAIRLLGDHGVNETWYYKCAALVLAGSRSCLSQSGQDYIPSDEPFGSANLVTVDLSPSINGIWGDCARTFYLERGVAVGVPQKLEFRRGQQALHLLHSTLPSYAKPEMTLGELFDHATAQIRALGFVNLDFLENVGHSIEPDLASRTFIESGNRCRLKRIPLFTFEPHIKAEDGLWGFKHEEIYFFDNGILQTI